LTHAGRRASWLFAIEWGDAPADTIALTMDDWTLDGDVVRSDGNAIVECRSATDMQRAGCATG
jgi:hypothetical protein